MRCELARAIAVKRRKDCLQPSDATRSQLSGEFGQPPAVPLSHNSNASAPPGGSRAPGGVGRSIGACSHRIGVMARENAWSSGLTLCSS
jgi:hypothetical protein